MKDATLLGRPGLPEWSDSFQMFPDLEMFFADVGPVVVVPHCGMRGQSGSGPNSGAQRSLGEATVIPVIIDVFLLFPAGTL